MNDLTETERHDLFTCLHLEEKCKMLWLRAIENSPKLVRYCKRLNDFSTAEWAGLLSYHPDFINVAPIQDFSVNEWVLLLSCQPQLASECKIKRKFSAQQKAYLAERKKILEANK